MSAFIRASLHSIELDAEEGDHIITRYLKLRVQDVVFEVFDTHPDLRQLEIGQTFVWLIKLAFARPLVSAAETDDTAPPLWQAVPGYGATQARILDTHWWAPSSWDTTILDADKRQSVVLLDTPIGWMITNRRLLTEDFSNRSHVGDVLLWDRARLDLIGVAGVPITLPAPTGRVGNRPKPEADGATAPEPHAPPPAIQERLDQHVVWLDSSGQQGLQFGMRPDLGSPPLNTRNQDLRAVLLAKVRLNEASLVQVRLDGADLRGADLTHAYFAKGSLVGAMLDGANLTRARGPRANLSRASLLHVDADGADFSNTNLRGANLTEAQAVGADFQDADLTDANLENADLTDANLENAHLAGARLTGARLMGACLEGATGVESAQAAYAFVGAPDAPQRLDGDALRQWLREAVVKKTRVVVDVPEE